ncbi:MAG: FAD binding domain-containing protein [Pedococcus sp.]
MKPAPFVHHAPRTVEEAVTVLAQVGHDGKVLAGGQSLIPILNMRLASPAHLVDINTVAGLDEVTVSIDAVRVGALVRHAGLEAHEGAYAVSPLLRRAVRHVAHPAIRNRGTTVGSIAHADAAGEMPAILALTDGVVEAVGPTGAREIPWHAFFLGALETSLAADELAVAVRFPRLPGATGTAFAERARRHGDYALAGVASAVRVEDGVITSARLSFVSVTEVPGCLDVTEAVQGRAADDLDWSVCDELIRDHLTPEADIHATAEYRTMLATRLAHLTLAEAALDSLALQPGSANDLADAPTAGPAA